MDNRLRNSLYQNIYTVDNDILNELSKNGGGGNGDGYSKIEADNRFQPKGNYALESALAEYLKTAVADGKYQLKGNYALVGASYTKTESDTKYALKSEIGGDFDPDKYYTKLEVDNTFATKEEMYNYVTATIGSSGSSSGNVVLMDKLDKGGRYLVHFDINGATYPNDDHAFLTVTTNTENAVVRQQHTYIRDYKVGTKKFSNFWESYRTKTNGEWGAWATTRDDDLQEFYRPLNNLPANSTETEVVQYVYDNKMSGKFVHKDTFVHSFINPSNEATSLITSIVSADGGTLMNTVYRVVGGVLTKIGTFPSEGDIDEKFDKYYTKNQTDTKITEVMKPATDFIDTIKPKFFNVALGADIPPSVADLYSPPVPCKGFRAGDLVAFEYAIKFKSLIRINGGSTVIANVPKEFAPTIVSSGSVQVVKYTPISGSTELRRTDTFYPAVVRTDGRVMVGASTFRENMNPNDEMFVTATYSLIFNEDGSRPQLPIDIGEIGDPTENKASDDDLRNVRVELQSYIEKLEQRILALEGK